MVNVALVQPLKRQWFSERLHHKWIPININREAWTLVSLSIGHSNGTCSLWNTYSVLWFMSYYAYGKHYHSTNWVDKSSSQYVIGSCAISEKVHRILISYINIIHFVWHGFGICHVLIWNSLHRFNSEIAETSTIVKCI